MLARIRSSNRKMSADAGSKPVPAFALERFSRSSSGLKRDAHLQHGVGVCWQVYRHMRGGGSGSMGIEPKFFRRIQRCEITRPTMFVVVGRLPASKAQGGGNPPPTAGQPPLVT